MGETILTTNKLCKTFSNEGVQQHVLRNLDISFEKGDFTVIMGASGAGKSTLLYALSGMDKPTLGDIYYGNTKISGYSNDKLAVFRRRHCGFVFQQIYLLENMSVLDNVMAVGLLADKNKKEVSELLLISRRLCLRMNLQAHLILPMGKQFWIPLPIVTRKGRALSW